MNEDYTSVRPPQNLWQSPARSQEEIRLQEIFIGFGSILAKYYTSAEDQEKILCFAASPDAFVAFRHGMTCKIYPAEET